MREMITHAVFQEEIFGDVRAKSETERPMGSHQAPGPKFLTIKASLMDKGVCLPL